jgi:ribosomal protein S18 acetylase RimI-like enzyme
MPFRIRRLQACEEAVLEVLAREDAHFDIDGRGGCDETLTVADSRTFLEDPAVLFWIAESDGAVVGFMYCHVLRKRVRPAREVLLYEVGVRKGHRRTGIGRALTDAVIAWMKTEGVSEIWVAADNDGAVAFYRANGFDEPEGMAVYMTREL